MLFAIEMVFKLAAYGFKGYWADTFNRFDGFIVVASCLEVVTEFIALPINTQVLT